MKTKVPGAKLAANVSARIRDFCAIRSISDETLVRSAKLTPAEARLLEAASEKMTTDMLERIAAVFDIHPAVLCMDPNECPIASMLETHRDLPKEEFQKVAGELVSKGFFRSKGMA